MEVGREMKLYMGETREELQLKVRLAIKEYREMGFLPQLSTPVLSHIARDLDPGFVLRPRPELNPTIYQEEVSEEKRRVITQSWYDLGTHAATDVEATGHGLECR